MGEVLAITGRVLPVTNEDIRLMAEFEDGNVIYGESKIYEAKKACDCRIKRVQIIPSPVSALPESVKAIQEADLIVLGPGSLYTSLIPNLLVGGIVRAIENSGAEKLYISNIMTQPGETEGYTVSDHIRELFRHSSSRLFNMCLVNSAPPSPDLLARYAEEGSEQIRADTDSIGKLGVEVISAPIWERYNGLVRHHPDRLAREIMSIFRNRAPTRTFEGRKAAQ